jgi:hypothetical protein
VTATLDLITLTLHLAISAKELHRIEPMFRCAPAQHDEYARVLMTQILHERAHLTSFLASDLSIVHRRILDIQANQAQRVVVEMGASRLLEHITVPLLDRCGRLFPNVLGAYAKLQVEAARRARRQLDDLNQFLIGQALVCDCAHLLYAYQRFLQLSNIVPPQEHAFLCATPTVIGRSSPAADAICFMHESHRALASAELCHPPHRLASSPPILPKIRAHHVPGCDDPMLLCSRSVLEGFAIIGELIGSRARYRTPSPTARRNVPRTYQAALLYCLERINHASGERFSWPELLAGALPEWVYVTAAAMLDLALQIEAPAPPMNRHAALIEKCPAWRLVLISASIGTDGALIAPRPSLHDRDIHAWSREVSSRLGWRTSDHRTSEEVTHARLGQRTPVTSENLFEHLRSVAAAQRDQHRLRYLTGQTHLIEGEWLDFMAWTTRDRQDVFMTADHAAARGDFIAHRRQRYYGLSALTFGVYWDAWWLHQGVRYPQHGPTIAALLNAAIRLPPPYGALPDRTQSVFLAHHLSVREEFAEILGPDTMNDPSAAGSV